MEKMSALEALLSEIGVRECSLHKVTEIASDSKYWAQHWICHASASPTAYYASQVCACFEIARRVARA